MVRVAVVHDYFTQHGGAENVAGELYNLVPQADMFATVALDKYVPDCIPREKLQTSWMQNLPRHRGSLPAVFSTVSTRRAVVGSFAVTTS